LCQKHLLAAGIVSISFPWVECYDDWRGI
jgi:hypothetical protein